MTLKEFSRCCMTELSITIIEIKDYILVETRVYNDVYTLFLEALNKDDAFYQREVKWFAEDLDRNTMKVRII